MREVGQRIQRMLHKTAINLKFCKKVTNRKRQEVTVFCQLNLEIQSMFQSFKARLTGAPNESEVQPVIKTWTSKKVYSTGTN